MFERRWLMHRLQSVVANEESSLLLDEDVQRSELGADGCHLKVVSE